MQKAVLFDLDGTLTDPFLGITRSVAYSLKSFGIEVHDLNVLKPFIGPPLDESFQKYYHMNQADSLLAVERYREYFSRQGLYENQVYEGIEDLLRRLKKEGYLLYVCTSKPEFFSRQILEHFALIDYFDGVFGATLDGQRKQKGDVIAYCLQQTHLQSHECLMIGDRMYDVVGAHRHHIPCIGVLYGYGSREELVEYHCEAIANDLSELYEIIRSMTKEHVENVK